ncbi:MAG: hypothetical protein ACOH2H_14100 [Cypionkella sp.]
MAGAGAQSSNLNEINTGVSQLDQVNQQKTAMVQEAIAARQTLREEARELVHLVSWFRTQEADAGSVQPRQRSARRA